MGLADEAYDLWKMYAILNWQQRARPTLSVRFSSTPHQLFLQQWPWVWSSGSEHFCTVDSQREWYRVHWGICTAVEKHTQSLLALAYGRESSNSLSPWEHAHLHRDMQLYLKSNQLFRQFPVPEKLQSQTADICRHHHTLNSYSSSQAVRK